MNTGHPIPHRSSLLRTLEQLLIKVLPRRAIGALRAKRLKRVIDAYPTRVVEHRFGRGELKVYLADPLAEGWYDKDWAELPEIALLARSRLKPGARVFDLGAHQAVVALMLAREVGPSGSVLAVDANIHNVTIARKNRELNGAAQLELLHSAISDHSGFLIFNQLLNGQIDVASGAHGSQRVPTTTVDALAAERGVPDVVFIDIEGAECLALAGASAVLRGNTDFFVEVHVGCGLEQLGGSVETLLSFFPESQFTLQGKAPDDERFRPLTPHDPLFASRFFLLALRRPV